MSHKTQPTQHKPVENQFRLKPSVACIKLVITGGLFASAVAPVYADLPLPVPGQGWVSSGSASSQVLGNTLRIDQHTDKAILNWQSFNVGKENTVQFVQPGSSSVALNRINQQDASRILGQIKANGQVYLYNKNGFVFGKDSVVNANSLIASTLNISDEVFNRGITQVFDANGKAAFGDRPDSSDVTTEVNKDSFVRFEKGLKTDDDGFLIDKNNKQVLDQLGNKILVKPGFDTNSTGQLIGANGKVVLDISGKPIVPVPVQAQLHVDKNGRIIIVAPTIVNKGSLSSDTQGQIILAASQDKVYLQMADKNDPFAGLVVEVDTGGKVTNEKTGEILARQGNVT
ncbi:MAG: filamentous hemagglutinin N-terminal domain-containing protein, partial [Methylobacter sp.]|nr:filamentous hemagglutinin N-terminal domain-containing protein [Methylobacter sp.]